ncbi:MAG: two-component system sensor histidine kinase EnvZ [Enterobacterales bacterium]|nr:two-component system sensor histidine kinase EnvZ [Enterobacterales bacterium]
MKVQIFPKSFFGRNALMIATLLVISQMISFVTVQHFVVDKKNRTIMYLVTNQIKLQYLGAENDIPKNLSVGFSETTELELFWINSGLLPDGLAEAEAHPAFTKAATEFLGDGTEVRIELSDRVYVWVNEPVHPKYWIRMPIGEYDGSAPLSLLIFSTVILFLSLIGAWALVKQLHRPLKRLAFAAREIGRGDYPGKLKETGPQELVDVTSTFNQMAADIHQLEEDRTLLLAGISHDLRTPITRIRLSCEFLSTQDEELKQGLIADTQDMDDIIDQFIGYVRFGSEEAKELGDLNDLIEQVVSAANKQHEGIKTELSKIPKIKFKPLAMKRLLSNLIENAFRYGKAPVIVLTQHTAEIIQIIVRDHGKGILDLDRERLFQPFARGDKARGGKGSGLGLAIVQRIAEMHGGTIQLENHPKGGLEAQLTIPLSDKSH